MHTHKPARRNFLKLSARLATLGLTGLGFGPGRAFFVSEAHAATVTDYKALVCIYLFGGNDSNNMIVPIAGIPGSTYTEYQAIRAGLRLNADRLTPEFTDLAGNRFALFNAMSDIHTLFTQNRIAMVLNTGALERPLTRAQYRGGMRAPDNLFSHSDQTLQAQTGHSNIVGGGWGGRLLDVFGVNDTLGAISVSSAATFLQSNGNAPNVIPPGASLGLSGMNFSPSSAATARKQAVAAMLAMDGGHPLRAASNSAFADGLQLAETLRDTGSAAQINTVFPGTGLGNQLKEVAKLIKLRSQIGPGRQVFFCSLGGFDTHTSQDGTHTSLLQQLSQAMAAFSRATDEIGLPNNVTAFTQSEFNRTMEPNGTGTDHAWGGHQFVLGGAVRPGIYGRMPLLALGGDDDANDRGAWIPGISTSQFGATLGKWFGASPTELQSTFPNLVNFGAATDIGFMR